MTDIISDQEISEMSQQGSETAKLSEQLASEEIWRKCLEWHDEFDRNIWENKSSFHNRSHIEAVVSATDIYLRNCTNESDPLELWQSLTLWNETHSDNSISDDDLREAILYAVYCHDLGNIMTSLSVENDQFVPSYLPTYTAGKDPITGMVAEERSQNIAQILMQRSNLDENKKKIYLPFVKHLINETKFLQEDIKSPFSKFMRVVDQIGNDLFSDNENRLIGLLNENEKEKPDAKANPHFFVSFASERLRQLILDEEDRIKLLKIWGKNLPKEVKGLPQEQKPVSEVKKIISLNNSNN